MGLVGAVLMTDALIILCSQSATETRRITMKRVMINKRSVELTEDSLNSFIKSKVNSCDREVK